MTPDTLQLLFSDKQIEQRIRELAALISADYHGRHLVIVGVLKGCFVFLADIIRSLDLDLTIDFVQVASYGARRESSGVSTLEKDLGTDILGRDVLIVEDIVDTGITLNQIRERILMRSPKSLKICTFLDKKERRVVDVPLDYIGFEIPNLFVVGYGLDYDNKFRNLPYISVFKKKA